jgi:VanZ family protein
MEKRRWWIFAGWLALVGVIILLADTGHLAWFLKFLQMHEGSDKICHFFLIGTLAYLFNFALARRKLGPVLLGSLVVAVVMTGEEISQKWIPGRSFDYADMAANLAGCIAADLLSRRKRK